MKVIIQDVETTEYFSVSGGWSQRIGDARDFLTLLRAYHFARENTTRNFQVVLYCPDDSYTANIVGGTGEAKTGSLPHNLPIEMLSEPSEAWAPEISFIRSGNRRSRFHVRRLTPPRPYLN